MSLSNVYTCIGYSSNDILSKATTFVYPCNEGEQLVTQSIVAFTIKPNADNPPEKKELPIIEPKEINSFYDNKKMISTTLNISPVSFYIKKKDYGIRLFPNLSTQVKFRILGDSGEDEEDKGGNIDKLLFTFQKNIFIEFDITFISDTLTIESVSGLPTGLMFKDGKIKGSPMEAGVFPFEIFLNDNTTINGIIEIPNLVRLM